MKQKVCSIVPGGAVNFMFCTNTAYLCLLSLPPLMPSRESFLLARQLQSRFTIYHQNLSPHIPCHPKTITGKKVGDHSFLFFHFPTLTLCPSMSRVFMIQTKINISTHVLQILATFLHLQYFPSFLYMLHIANMKLLNFIV